jgi:hypothetical protein
METGRFLRSSKDGTMASNADVEGLAGCLAVPVVLGVLAAAAIAFGVAILAIFATPWVLAAIGLGALVGGLSAGFFCWRQKMSRKARIVGTLLGAVVGAMTFGVSNYFLPGMSLAAAGSGAALSATTSGFFGWGVSKEEEEFQTEQKERAQEEAAYRREASAYRVNESGPEQERSRAGGLELDPEERPHEDNKGVERTDPDPGLTQAVSRVNKD